MTKVIAILNVIAWSGFWAFGYIAISSDSLSDGQLMVASLLAFAGLITGLFAYLKLVRAAEASGYAKKSNQLDAAARENAHAQGS
ncbi:hypothetical protein Q8W37_14105 [Shimia thalassica]|jgi:TctA family transporter|uniref:Uncharacterized protein n=1 Tax=Shimia thalassica TaxID=1715693 RepID=A0A0P1IHQ0_9RHOB|nr:hypothetical protein [Shimia thalassica]PHO05470.1 hypothetical protein CSC82_03640 [Rhodobacteraceae bacterium 4F10]MBU2942472.1 hypothetical protein [Shimia thalassica]MDO6479657.1 hypothetical protein [Shimia thalassica]MDO6485347.1 hypothetical protein [Shimia thalassica]MDO6504400.1 hypothetical protein [Shimia thalassica]